MKVQSLLLLGHAGNLNLMEIKLFKKMMDCNECNLMLHMENRRPYAKQQNSNNHS